MAYVLERSKNDADSNVRGAGCFVCSLFLLNVDRWQFGLKIVIESILKG